MCELEKHGETNRESVGIERLQAMIDRLAQSYERLRNLIEQLMVMIGRIRINYERFDK